MIGSRSVTRISPTQKLSRAQLQAPDECAVNADDHHSCTYPSSSWQHCSFGLSGKVLLLNSVPNLEEPGLHHSAGTSLVNDGRCLGADREGARKPLSSVLLSYFLSCSALRAVGEPNIGSMKLELAAVPYSLGVMSPPPSGANLFRAFQEHFITETWPS